jgi:4-amino-4-deoxy-L-arabinose transferase-like glycosyltransferase
METPLDDSQLLRLAAAPRVRLFPEPSRTSVLAPLVIVMSLLPALAIALTPGLDEISSVWGLRSMDVAMAHQLSGWLKPGADGFGKSLAYQPPFVSWIQAIIVRAMGIERSLSWHVVSFLATCGCVVATYRFARRLGGASFSLVVTVCLSCHPLTLHLATGTTPGSLGMFFIVVSVWGLLSHLEGPPSLVSLRLLVGALAWAGALLTVGPVAIALLLLLLMHVFGFQDGMSRQTGSCSVSAVVWTGLIALLILLATGLSFSSWWEVMMLSDHGAEHWSSWWTGSLLRDPSLTPVRHLKRNWFADNAFLWGWLIVGMVSVFRQAWRPTSELGCRRLQLNGLWWLVALAARITFGFLEPGDSVQRELWDSFLLLPTLLMVGWGVEVVVKRQTSPMIEALLIALTVSLIGWRLTDRAAVGLIAVVLILVGLTLFPMFASRRQGFSNNEGERNWRRLLQVFVVSFLVWHIVVGLVWQPRATLDDVTLAELRQRLGLISPVRKITIVASNATVPASLVFQFHSRWPAAQFAIAESWNADSAVGTPHAANGGTSEELVVEWSRRDARLTAENFAIFEAKPVGDPLRYGGRQLVLYLIGRPLRSSL